MKYFENKPVIKCIYGVRYSGDYDFLGFSTDYEEACKLQAENEGSYIYTFANKGFEDSISQDDVSKILKDRYWNS